MTNEEDFVHGFCSDCGKKMPDKWMYNNAFAQGNSSPSCTTCGGVVIVVDERSAYSEIAKAQRARGISKETPSTSDE